MKKGHSRRANYTVIEETSGHILIKDLGPWDKFLTVTNGVEDVVEELAYKLKDRRLFYIDTDGDLDEIIVEDGKFVRFAPGPLRAL